MKEENVFCLTFLKEVKKKIRVGVRVVCQTFSIYGTYLIEYVV
jgi:hypothetical protein